jgi:hypothetical protein
LNFPCGSDGILLPYASCPGMTSCSSSWCCQPFD